MAIGSIAKRKKQDLINQLNLLRDRKAVAKNKLDFISAQIDQVQAAITAIDTDVAQLPAGMKAEAV
jgi:hypothetical protein